MVYPEGNALPHQLGGVQNLLHFQGADTVARGFDHLITPPDEVKEAFRILAHVVARENSVFGQLQARFTTRRARDLGATDLDEAAAVQILELYLQGQEYKNSDALTGASHNSGINDIKHKKIK